MKIINAYVELINAPEYETMLNTVETAGRVCYKSEERMGPGTAEPFIRGIIKRGHEAVLEHSSITVRFVCDRGVTHEIVRHRMSSYCMESTRYCNYANGKFGEEITVIRPSFFKPWDEMELEDKYKYLAWSNGCQRAEESYLAMIHRGASAQEARSVLPHSVKAELIMTANVREWRHFLKLRNNPAAHPQTKEVAGLLQDELVKRYPVFFEDLNHEQQD